MTKKEKKYDIFISYRRDGGAQYARILQLMLIQRGYKVFLDYDELTDGVFGDHIKQAISKAPVFMLVMSKGALRRCVNSDDWMRQEVLLALEQGKHFVPINPDNSFDGLPPDIDANHAIPDAMREAINDHQHSEISFGQMLGPSVDLLIKHRLVPTLGKRDAIGRQDTDFDSATERLMRSDAHRRFMKRLAVGTAATAIAVITFAIIAFWCSYNSQQQQAADQQALTAMRFKLEKKHANYNLFLAPQLTLQQMETIDDILSHLVMVKADSLWICQFETSCKWWHGILGNDGVKGDNSGDNADVSSCLPVTGVSLGQVFLFIDSLVNITNIPFDLPSAQEWEYAAHGGNHAETTRYAGSNDADAVAWHKDNTNGALHPSDGQQGLLPNCLDIFDLCGNAAEMVNTPFGTSGQYTVCGGDCTSAPEEVTITSRRGIDPDYGNATTGFRLVVRCE